jgi:hypothetical protein
MHLMLRRLSPKYLHLMLTRLSPKYLPRLYKTFHTVVKQANIIDVRITIACISGMLKGTK